MVVVKPRFQPILDKRAPEVGFDAEGLRAASAALRASVSGGELSWLIEGGYEPESVLEKFSAMFAQLDDHLAKHELEAACHALLQTAEFAGFCQGVAVARFSASEEVRLRDVEKAHLAQEARRVNKARHHGEIAAIVLGRRDAGSLWSDWAKLEAAVRSAINEHPAKLRDTDGRVKEILRDPRIAPLIATLKPPARRKPNRKPIPRALEP